MMEVVEWSVLMVVVVPLLFVLLIRRRDLPAPEATSSTGYLHERRSRIHENLRDLQFDFRTGKLSQDDYLSGKLSLQRELAAVLTQMEEGKAPVRDACSACGVKFTRAMKFCGACGEAVRC